MGVTPRTSSLTAYGVERRWISLSWRASRGRDRCAAAAQGRWFGVALDRPCQWIVELEGAYGMSDEGLFASATDVLVWVQERAWHLMRVLPVDESNPVLMGLLLAYTSLEAAACAAREQKDPSVDAIADLRVPNLEFLRRVLGLEDEIPPAFRRAFEGDH
jgi:hypothetical protein